MSTEGESILVCDYPEGEYKDAVFAYVRDGILFCRHRDVNGEVVGVVLSYKYAKDLDGNTINAGE